MLKKCLKPMRIAVNAEKAHPTPESDFSPFEPPASRSMPPHTLTQLRTHARTTRTRNETETDFPIGVNCVDDSPQSPTDSSNKWSLNNSKELFR